MNVQTNVFYWQVQIIYDFLLKKNKPFNHTPAFT